MSDTEVTDMERRLAAIIRVLLTAGLPAGERKLATRHAVELGMIGDRAVVKPKAQSEQNIVTHDVLNNFEGVLKQVANASGLDRISVTMAKERLKSLGQEGARLAARLGRMSKKRNSHAHPDPGLRDDIALAFAGLGKKDTSTSQISGPAGASTSDDASGAVPFADMDTVEDSGEDYQEELSEDRSITHIDNEEQNQSRACSENHPSRKQAKTKRKKQIEEEQSGKEVELVDPKRDKYAGEAETRDAAHVEHEQLFTYNAELRRGDCGVQNPDLRQAAQEWNPDPNRNCSLLKVEAACMAAIADAAMSADEWEAAAERLDELRDCLQRLDEQVKSEMYKCMT